VWLDSAWSPSVLWKGAALVAWSKMRCLDRLQLGFRVEGFATLTAHGRGDGNMSPCPSRHIGRGAYIDSDVGMLSYLSVPHSLVLLCFCAGSPSACCSPWCPVQMSLCLSCTAATQQPCWSLASSTACSSTLWHKGVGYPQNPMGCMSELAALGPRESLKYEGFESWLTCLVFVSHCVSESPLVRVTGAGCSRGVPPWTPLCWLYEASGETL
jgi:hypothetical protein